MLNFLSEALKREVHHALHLCLQRSEHPCLKHSPLLLPEPFLKDVGVHNAANPRHRDLEVRSDLPVGSCRIGEQVVHDRLVANSELLDLWQAHGMERPFAELG